MCPSIGYGDGVLPINPVPHIETVNAIRHHFRNWVMKDVAPPPSRYPTLAAKYLVDATKDAMGFPTSMFTPIFAISRTVGWISQWKEMIAEHNQKIGRPRQLYVGAPMRDYVNLAKR